ncbi:hypothetical protein [Halorientalis marina]|uniref:hypothetical protein n=1 Tax=Halorientalis marina TaxID=2931976 RepID=UPI001FF15D85|nr:hypothetical protein [Halorientalis marina]
MKSWVRVSAVVSVAVLVFLAAGQPVAGQSEEYDISVDGSIDTPDREITFEGDSYHVSAVKQADSGDTATVNVEAPSDRLVKVLLYNSDRQIVEQKTLSEAGSGSVSFDLSSISTGSYMFVVQHSGETQAVHPLVIRAYDVSMTAPSEATTDETIELSATLTQLQSESMSGVEFVILNDAQTLRVDATGDGDSYQATADLSSLDAGTYSVYATVRGTEEVEGNKVRLGLSQPQSLTISEESTTTSDGSSGGNSGSDGSGGSGSSDGGGAVAPSTETPTEIPTTVSGTNTTATGQQQTSPDTTAASDSAQTPDTATPTASGQEMTTTSAGTTTTESNAITPRSPTSVASSTTTTTGPGFGAGLASIAALVGAVSLARRQRR